MKTPESILTEIADYVRASHGAVFVMIEWKEQDKPNWVAASTALDGQQKERYLEKISMLRNSDPAVDWRDVKFVDGVRRIAVRASDADG